MKNKKAEVNSFQDDKFVSIVQTPLILHYIGKLRDEKTNSEEFRGTMEKLVTILVGAANLNLELETKKIRTPLEEAEIKVIKKEIILVPILRAGIAMSKVFANLIPNVKIGHVGCFRKDDLEVQRYFSSLPKNIQREKNRILVLDPMLATGKSALKVIEEIKKETDVQIDCFFIIAAEEGIKKIREAFPKIKIFVCSIDRELDEKKYIRPGLGDAGDRYFGT